MWIAARSWRLNGRAMEPGRAEPSSRLNDILGAGAGPAFDQSLGFEFLSLSRLTAVLQLASSVLFRCRRRGL